MEHTPFFALPHVTGPAWPGLRYVTTTRQEGVSQGAWASFNLATHCQDRPEHVQRNRQRLASALPAQPLWLDQVHGTTVLNADTWPQAACDTDPVPKADAAVTTRFERVLAILTADCLPVVLSDGQGSVLGVAHAGWRGLAAGVLENTLRCMQQLQPQAGQWRAWIGPAIQQDAFQVGDDVRNAFVVADAQAALFFKPDALPGKWRADLPGLAAHRLQQAGVACISVSPDCSFKDSDRFYSYRRQATTGRMATLAWLVPHG